MEELKDRTSELMERFKRMYEAWADPTSDESVTLPQVDSARRDVLEHRRELYRAGILKNRG